MLKKVKNKYKESLKDKNFSEILSGSVLTFLVKILTVLLGFLTNLIITKYYGAEVLGTISILVSIMSVASIFSLLGINIAILRFLPPLVKRKEYENIYLIIKKAIHFVFVFSLISAFVIYIFSDLLAIDMFQKPYLDNFIVLVSFFILVHAFSILASSIIRSLQEMKIFILLQFLPSFLNLIFLISITYFYYYEYNPLYSQLSVEVIIAIISLLYVLKYINNIKKTKDKVAHFTGLGYKEFLKVSIPMFLTAAMQMVVLQTDVFMLGSLSTIENVGIYTIVMKLALLNSFIIGSINTIIAPKFSELYYNNNLLELKSIARKSTKLIFYSTIPISIILFIFGSYLLSIFGNEFIIGYNALILLAIGQLFNAVAGSVGYLLNMTGNQDKLNQIVISSAIINIILNYILIPRYGINGAAFASMLSAIYWNTVASLYVKKYLGFYIWYFPIKISKDKK